ncbi:Hypothetical_protein [Hexamita inflata]|uniref:Hypothetical_protein n=1 Tax=Hexamita inflata TaxID=28002 RepID=A0AA86UZR3_9EUKA|nr:Hypothetical protein HINF_LOCUS58366 [Hexamita inflata]
MPTHQRPNNIYIYTQLSFILVRSSGTVSSRQTLEKSQSTTSNIPEIRNLQNQINQEGPRYIIKLMKQCIKGNHHQAMPIQRNNLPYKPKEITSKEKLRRENQFLEMKLANQVKLVADDSVRALVGLY